jgi:hypothetical protein
LPAVVFVTGYPDPGAEKIFGCKVKEMECYISWAKLMAASGLAAITYLNHDPARDLDALFRHLRENAETLGIDQRRMGVWSCSGIGFANPAAGKSVHDLPPELPLFIARAGRDEPGLNDTLDRFIPHALSANLPITLANHATGPHAFDVLDDNETSCEIVRQILAFLRLHF